MRLPAIFRNTGPLFILLWLALFSIEAQAAIESAGVLDNVLDRYSAAAAGWAAIITERASWLFWTLVVISMVWTFGFMALRKADIGEFFAEFIRFTIFTGFFWWLLTNGPRFANDIMRSLRTLGGNASGTGSELTPSGIVDIGFDIFFKVVDQSSLWSPVNSAVGIIVSAVILIILGLIGVNMLLLLVSSWMLAYAGVFFLGFGGSRWTSDMAINYYNAMEVNINLKELGVMLIVSVVLLALVNKLPAMIGGLAMGGGTHALGSGYGTGTAMGAAAVAGAAMATGGAAILAGGSSMGGGAQALMAAYSKAAASSSGAGDGMGNMGGVATAARGFGGGNSGGGSVFSSMDNDSRSGSGSSSFGGSGGSFDGDAAESASSGEKANASSSEDKASGGRQAVDGESKSDAGTKAASSDTKEGGPGNDLAPGEQRSSSSMLGRAASIAAGTAGNLAMGTWDVAKAKGASLRESAFDRIGDTTGGKIAAAIKARDAAAPVPSSAAQTGAAFSDNELSAGKAQAQAPDASEVAAFVNRSSNIA